MERNDRKQKRTEKTEATMGVDWERGKLERDDEKEKTSRRFDKERNPFSRSRTAPETEERSEPKSEKNGAPKPNVTFTPRKPTYRLDDIVLNAEVKRQIAILKSRIDYHSELYENWGLQKIDPQGKRVSVSFYGPPGTGKTMCAEGLASELGVDLIEVSYAEIESKYVGDTGKNIRAAFQAAKKTGSLLFFDEADAILGARMSNVTQAADHAVDAARAVMLKELDAFEGVVVFATNKFGKYDGAFLRRILQHVEVPTPDLETREKLWRLFLLEKTTIPGAETLDCRELAEKSPGMAGGDVKNCVVVACSEAVASPEKRITQTLLLKAIRQIEESKAKHDDGELKPTPTRTETKTITFAEFEAERAAKTSAAPKESRSDADVG